MQKVFSVSTLSVAVCVMAALTATSMPALAENLDMTVVGSIVPAACTPTVSGGGVIDYGNIDPSSLSATNYTLLAEKTLGFSIVCDAQVKVALQAVNGRPNTAAGVSNGGSNSGDGSAPISMYGRAGIDVGIVGLGLDGAIKIGGYGVRLLSAETRVDGLVVDTLAKTIGGAAWARLVNADELYDPDYSRLVTWGATGTITPVAFTTLSGQLGVQAYLNMTSVLNVSRPIHLDGLTTIEILYL